MHYVNTIFAFSFRGNSLLEKGKYLVVEGSDRFRIFFLGGRLGEKG